MTETIVVPGRRLGRRVNHDPRSRRYAYTPKTAALTSVRHTRYAPVFDQGDVGSCTGNACLGAIGTGPLHDDLAAAGTLPTFDEATAVKLYSLATTLDSAPGSYPPDDTGSDGLSVAKAAQQDGWLSGYQHALSYDAALLALVDGPVIVGVDWYAGFDTPTAAGQMRLSGQVRGGHELCVDEIDVENQRVWVTNSWSTSWGLDGRAWWSFATFKRLLARDGDCTILVPVTAPAPTPDPEPTPTPSPAPGGDGWFQVDAATADRVARAATRRGVTPNQWLQAHLDHYFHLG